ncbi:MAG TPA: oxidoreductase [Verrucomicrobiae bacterium]|jgi:short-subunit dehydrogenase
MSKIALVTGASSGIGEATALRLASMGITTYAAARRTERMEHLKSHGIRIRQLDLTDEKSIQGCVAGICAESGGIDILINNAGYGSYGSIEEVPLSEARRQFEVNLFGLAALTQLVIPRLRQQRRGWIINITSIAGIHALPYGGWYHATKFAVEGLSSALRQELQPFDVNVVIIRPGLIKTEWSNIATQSLTEVSGKGPYAAAVRAIYTLFKSDKITNLAAAPSVIADVVQKIVLAKHPRSVYTAPFAGRLMVRLGKLAGCDYLRDRINRVFMGLPRKM